MPGRVKKGLIDHKGLSNVKAGPGWPPIYSELLWFNLQTGCFSRLWVLSATHVSALRYDLLHAPFISFEGRKLNSRVEEGNCSKYTHINWSLLCGYIIGVWTTIKNYIKMKLIFTPLKWLRTFPPLAALHLFFFLPSPVCSNHMNLISLMFKVKKEKYLQFCSFFKNSIL